MKTTFFTKKAVTIIVVLSTIAAYSFINKKIDNIDLFIQDPIEQRILGIWIMEDSPSLQIEYLSNGQLKRYEDNILLYTDTYSISNTCDGETMNNYNEYFLKQIDSEFGAEHCFIINGVNENNSGILSLTTSGQGKIIIYVRP